MKRWAKSGARGRPAVSFRVDGQPPTALADIRFKKFKGKRVLIQMCCNRINTDALMANLFAVSGEIAEQVPMEFSVSSLGDYLSFLSERFPVYVASDFSMQAVDECVEEYPELYQKCEDKDGQTVIRSSGRELPNLAYFNASFSKDISTHISRMTKLYLNSIGI